jgi:siroheme synthase-like protein
VGYYPVFLELAGRPCLVIGGGTVAERKVAALLDAGAAVTVVSPGLAPGLRALVDAGRLHHRARAYRPGDLAGFRLCLVATDDGGGT